MKAQPEIFSNITDLAPRFRGLLLDLYGVLWGGNAYGLFPQVKETLDACVASGKIIGLLSNSTQLASKTIEQLHRHGLILGTHFHFLMTSGEIARSLFLNQRLPFPTPRNTFWLVGGVHPKFASHEALFEDTPYQETPYLDEADFVYTSIPHLHGEDQTDPELFRTDLKKIRSKNLPMVCPNPDQFAHEGNPPRAVVRQGSIARLYEELGGTVFYIGKPHLAAYKAAWERFQKAGITHPSEILMVGDTPETDIRGARSFGMPSALVLLTGIIADRISREGLDKTLQKLPPEDTPHYFINRFA